MSEERDLKEELALTRKAVADLEKILLREGSHAASYEERLADALRERDDAKTRLEVEQASNQFLQKQVDSLTVANQFLRTVISKCAEAIGNGSACLPTASLEFMGFIPKEIAAEVAALRKANGEEKASATRGWQTADELHLTVRDLKAEIARLRKALEEVGTKP